MKNPNQIVTEWTNMSYYDAESLAAETDLPVVFAADEVMGYARHLRDGETVASAQSDFEAAGEPATKCIVL